MKTVCCALLIHLAAGVAAAQTFDHLQVAIGAYNVTDDGGERPSGGWLSTGPVMIGRLLTGTISIGQTCTAFTISAVRGDVREDATVAWLIEVTPLGVVRDAVTFRLHWVRVAGVRRQLEQLLSESGTPPGATSEDIELTLRPDESWPLDSVRMPAGTKTSDGRMCR